MIVSRSRKALSEKHFVWIDVETTGLDPEQNDIIEFAAVRRTPDGREAAKFHFYVDIERPETVQAKALEINGYTSELWAAQGALSPSTAWQTLVDSGILDDAIVAGHNVGFDVAFLKSTFKRHGIKYRMDYHLFDTVTLALEHLQPFVSSVSLVAVCVALGIPVRDAHTALADAQMAAEVHRVLRLSPWYKRWWWKRVIPKRIERWTAAGKPPVWPPRISRP